MKTACMLAALVFIAVPCAYAAEQKDEPVPAYVIELKIDGDTVEVGEVQQAEFMVPPVEGTPQLQPLFYEALNGDGTVVHAGVLGKMCVHPESKAPSNSNAPAAPPESKDALTAIIDLIAIPVSTGAKELVVYKRSEDAGKDRKELKRVPLP